MVDTTFPEALAVTPANYVITGDEPLPVTGSGGEDYALTVSQVRGDTAQRFRVTDSAQAMALSTQLQSLPFMNEKAVVPATITITGNEINAGAFSTGNLVGDQLSGVLDPKEAYNDQFIALRLNGTSNFTRWFKVRRMRQQSAEDPIVFCYEDIPAGTYDGFKIGTLIYREVIFAPNDYLLDGFQCIPGLILSGEKGARIVEEQSGQQNPIIDVGENFFIGLAFYPNESWDALDGLWQARANQWAGTRFVVEDCLVRHGGMGGDHSGGPMSIPIFDGGYTILRDTDFQTSRYMVGYRSPVNDVVGAIQTTRLIFEDCTFERVGEWAADVNQLFPCQVFLPPNCSTLLIGCTFFWEADYSSFSGVRSCLLAGDISSVVGPENGTSDNALALVMSCRFAVNGKLGTNITDVNINIPAAITNDFATSRIIVSDTVINHRQPDTVSASSGAITCLAGSLTEIGSTRIFSNSVGISVSGNAQVDMGNGTLIEVDSIDPNATCLNAVTTSGTLSFSNCVLKILNQGRAINALLAVLSIGNNVEFTGSITNTSNTVTTPFRGIVTLGGTGVDLVTVADPDSMNEFQSILLQRITAGGTPAFLSIANRDDTAGTFEIISAAGDTSVVDYWLHT